MIDAVRIRLIVDSICKRCVEFSARLATSVDDLRQKAHESFSPVSSSDFGRYQPPNECESSSFDAPNRQERNLAQ